MARKTLLVGFAVLLLAVGAWAVDVVLKDGTVIPAVSYKVSGSYVMVQLEGGGQVAYDLADVDLESMRKAEAAAATGEEPPPEERAPRGNVISRARSQGGGKASLTISDGDVRHVGGTGEAAAPQDEEEASEQRREGGLVTVQAIRVEPGGKPGQWIATGEVVNRTDMTVSDVRALLQAVGPDHEPIGEAEVPVAGSLEPGGKGTFSHTFTAVSRPLLRVRVFWMQPEAPVATPRPGRPGGPSGAVPGAPAPKAPPGASGEGPRPAAGSRPSDLQWGGAPAYRHAGPPTPTPTR